ncbi:MAG TPA: type II CAAX endopeptidase family protein, partial [Bryobacteraceae bacterium]|nr:type II CAAX endopeptidase family protein [Bryobacteraceae bacterium]
IVFSSAALLAGAWTAPLCLLVLAYTVAPVICVWLARELPPERPSLLDFAAILLIWLPLEFAAGATLVRRAAQGFLHSVAYGIAILLGLILFAGFRNFPGLKYNLPGKGLDCWLPLAGYAISAPVLVLIGMALGFIPAPHGPVARAGAMAAAAPVIFFGTALPEEILFRSLIQNLLMLRFGSSWRTLLAASVIFGCAHLDNGPQPLPNWRYAIVATVAGVAYGAVFQRASTVLSSAALHMMVDWTKHYFF